MTGPNGEICMDPQGARIGLFRGAIVSLFGVLAFAPSLTWSGGLFRCLDGDGQSVFTDRLAQMTQCVPLSHESSSSPGSSPAPVPSPPTPVATEHSLTTRVLPMEAQPVNL